VCGSLTLRRAAYTLHMLRTLRSEVSPRDANTAFGLVAIAYGFFSFLDWMTTADALAQGGRESNPLAATLYAQYGSGALLLLKAVVVAAIIFALARIPRRVMSHRVAVWVGTAFVVATAVAVIGNAQALAALAHPAPHIQPVPNARLV
jgi:Domain of unknown function (DUF5658)